MKTQIIFHTDVMPSSGFHGKHIAWHTCTHTKIIMIIIINLNEINKYL